MEKTVTSTDYTVAELREWLQRLQLPTAGNKNTLVMRINEVPFDQRGEIPKTDADHVISSDDDESNEGEPEQPATGQHVGENVNAARDANIAENTNNNNEQANPQRDDSAYNIEYYKREYNLLKRENELLKREAQQERTAMALEAAACSTRSNFNVSDSMSVSLSMLKEMMPEYDGGESLVVWITQFESIKNVYAPDENTMRALLVSKMKGKAQLWLQSKPNFVAESVEVLLKEMSEFFGANDTKLSLRRRFEARKWKYGESFAEYYREKPILASGILMDQTEVIDYIVEGITDEQLRVQANMQRFTSQTQLLQAFAKIELKRKTSGAQCSTEKVPGENLRCFNCNSVGHFAANCKKPKREFGACFACGSLQHRAAACPERKMDQSSKTKNDYNA